MILYLLAAIGALTIGLVLLVFGLMLLAAKWSGWEDTATEDDWDGL
jgi:hypothetical protein